MAIRNIRVLGDDILRKKSKEVTEVTPRIKTLIEDMIDTMYENDGVGISAVQVGVLKRIFVIDVTGDNPIVFINPEIIESSGEECGAEGCLSVPGKNGMVTRPKYVKMKAYNIDMEPFEISGEDLFARAMCHENDHLNGVVYVDKVEGKLNNNDE